MRNKKSEIMTSIEVIALDLIPNVEYMEALLFLN